MDAFYLVKPTMDCLAADSTFTGEYAGPTYRAVDPRARSMSCNRHPLAKTSRGRPHSRCRLGSSRIQDRRCRLSGSTRWLPPRRPLCFDFPQVSPVTAPILQDGIPTLIRERLNTSRTEYLPPTSPSGAPTLGSRRMIAASRSSPSSSLAEIFPSGTLSPYVHAEPSCLSQCPLVTR